ncbi:MAG: DUF2793 domain-containing protein [Pseudomonadota bacterium]
MSSTAQLGLPLVQGAQAQKHVTVNEAFARLDGLTQLEISGAPVDPPLDPVDGQTFRVPTGATGDWTGAAGQLAIASNGGWVLMSPRAGWTAFDIALGETVAFDGVDWRALGRNPSAGGAVTSLPVREIDHDVTAGATSTTTTVIPANSIVFGVTGRVEVALTGTGTTGWSLGVSGADDRYGSGLGLGANSYALGLTGMPVTYYADTALQLTALGGDFTGGRVRLAVHCLTVTPPRAF